MLGHKKRRAKLAFNEAILTTFGKLDQKDIQTIDGNSDRLLTHLVRRYEWTTNNAESKVRRFRADLTGKSLNGVSSSSAGTEA
jgi:hypothetical protein